MHLLNQRDDKNESWISSSTGRIMRPKISEMYFGVDELSTPLLLFMLLNILCIVSSFIRVHGKCRSSP